MWWPDNRAYGAIIEEVDEEDDTVFFLRFDDGHEGYYMLHFIESAPRGTAQQVLADGLDDLVHDFHLIDAVDNMEVDSAAGTSSAHLRAPRSSGGGHSSSGGKQPVANGAASGAANGGGVEIAGRGMRARKTIDYKAQEDAYADLGGSDSDSDAPKKKSRAEVGK